MTHETGLPLSIVFAIIQDILIAFLIVRGFLTFKERRNSVNEHFVSLHPVVFWSGVVGSIVFCAPVSFPFALGVPFAAWCVFEFLTLLGIALICAYLFETITYDSVGFDRRNFLGRKTRFEYREITGRSPAGRDGRLFFGRRSVRIDSLALGGKDFTEYANKVYRSRWKKDIPVIKSKRDPMKGNIENPWVFFVLFLIGILGGVFLAVIAVIGMGKKGDFLAKILLLIFGIVVSAGCVLGIFVGRYPERFPEWTRELFFRKRSWISNNEIKLPDNKANVKKK
ncbi:MAG: hypothetical protein IKI91_05635 [Clostridia bacterium]|nr:hypothetical protein [Clostridia bacterium]